MVNCLELFIICVMSRVMYSGKQLNSFNSYCGVRQGEKLSPVLFSLFLNDLEDFLINSNCSGINLNVPGNDLDAYLKIITRLYTDDTLIFATDPATFQENINAFFEYSKRWKLNVNLNKTKILVFCVRNTMNFELGDNKTGIYDDFKYLGTVFTKHHTYFKAIKHNVDHKKKTTKKKKKKKKKNKKKKTKKKNSASFVQTH